MDFTKEQISELICKHSEKENGLQDILEMFIQSMMLAERRAYLDGEGLQGNKCNGFRPGRTYGQGRTLTFRIPRDRYGNFHPTILAMLRSQEDECERLAGTLYTKGLTQGDEDAWGDAQRGARHTAYGQDRHGQELVCEADAKNRSGQDAVPRRKTANFGGRALRS